MSDTAAPPPDDKPVAAAINDLWFEWGAKPDKDWPERKGRGSAAFARAVAQETRDALVRLLADRQRLLPPVETDDPFSVGFDAAIEVIRDAVI